ncbi:MAG: hypothetical protein HKN94_00105 [Acidimicrobiales bacterium]|nr:hypothetical protein [Acidimicrobiales bacterium]
MEKSVPDPSQLENRGFAALVDDGYTLPAQRTYIVLGLARGGTTMVAKVLEALGVFMGNDAGNVVGEDRALSDAIESGDQVAAQAIIDAYNADHDVWGFKRPNIVSHLTTLGVELRSPHFVIVMRDIFSIANRNLISVFKDPITDMRDSLHHLEDLVSFVEANQSQPMFFLSYERVLGDPREFVIDFADFCGEELDVMGIRKVMHAINPGGGDEYLQQSRVDSFMGRVTGASADSVNGFFRYHRGPEHPPLELFVNNEPVVADVQWDHIDLLRPNGRDFTGDHAFTLTITDGPTLHDGDRVSVVAADRRRQQLKNCPYKVRL